MTKKNSKAENVAVIDIGSNAVRLVVFDSIKRCPIKMHTERDICELGRDLAKTGYLNPEGVEKAWDSLTRFVGMLKSLKIKQVFAIATASLRDAKDGAKFVRRVKEKLGLEINVISGIEEARLSAQGVIAGFDNINGVVGDFGGGSLELISIKNNKIFEQETLPLGALRIVAINSEAEKISYIKDNLQNIPALDNYRGEVLYVVGGAWRSIGKMHMQMTNYSLKLLDHYTIKYKNAVEFTELLSKQSLASLEKVAGIPARRVKDIPPAALVMLQVLKELRPKEVCFSATGLREGVLFDHLPYQTQRVNPMLASFLDVGQKTSRTGDMKHLRYMAKWADIVFRNNSEIEDYKLVLESACLLSDIGWYEHEDYKAVNAYQRLLHLPVWGMSHRDRAIVALAIYVRYQGYLRRSRRNVEKDDEITASAQSILTKKQIDFAVKLGLVIRLAHILTGGALGLLKHTELKLTDKVLRLVLYDKASSLGGHMIKDELEQLAKQYKCKPIITLAN